MLHINILSPVTITHMHMGAVQPLGHGLLIPWFPLQQLTARSAGPPHHNPLALTIFPPCPWMFTYTYFMKSLRSLFWTHSKPLYLYA